MYRCQLCSRLATPGQKMERVTLEQRPAEYPSRPKAQRRRVGRKLKAFDDPGGAGYEIAKEAIACPACAREYAEKRAAAEAVEFE